MANRPVFIALAAALVVGILGTVAPAQAGSVKVEQQWQGKSETEDLRKDAPADSMITTSDAWKKIWTAWRTGDAPHVDFSTDFIVVAAVSGPNTVRIAVRVDDQGHATVLAMSTRMGGPGFGYAMARIKRAGIKTVDGTPVPQPPATAPATQPATQPATSPAATAPAAKPLAFDTFDGYFVKNTFEPDAPASFVVLADQKAFDAVFGAAFVMHDQAHRLPAGAFDKNIVVAAIKRGKALWDYKVETVRDTQGVVSVIYTSTQRAAGGAEFAVPLIVALPRGDYHAVEWVENAAAVHTQKLTPGT